MCINPAHLKEGTAAMNMQDAANKNRIAYGARHHLAKLDDDTCLVVVEPFSPMLRQELAKNLLWQRLGYGARANNSRCMAVLPPIWLYGGVSSMVVFGERLNQAHWLGGKAHG